MDLIFWNIRLVTQASLCSWQLILVQLTGACKYASQFTGIPPFKHKIRTRPHGKTRTLPASSSLLLFGPIHQSRIRIFCIQALTTALPTARLCIEMYIYLLMGCAALCRWYKSKPGTTWIPSCAHHPNFELRAGHLVPPSKKSPIHPPALSTYT